MGSTLAKAWASAGAQAKLPPSLWFSMEAESCWGARTRTDPGMTGAGTAGITPAEAAAAEAKTATKAFILSVLKKDISLTLAELGSKVISLSSLNSWGLARDNSSVPGSDQGLDLEASGWDVSSISISNATIVSLRLS